MHPYQAAKERPLVVMFCWERFEVLRMTLPRIVNATRRIGGYLWCIDDASDDDRVPRRLVEWKAKGLIDWVTLGKKGRHVDYVATFNNCCARRMVAIRYLYRHRVPLAILVEADVIVGEDVFSDLLEAYFLAFKESLQMSALSGFHYDVAIFSREPIKIGRFDIRLFCENIGQPLVLLPFGQMCKVERASPERNPNPQRFSINEYGLRAFRLGLLGGFVLNLPVQHLGVGIVGRGIASDIDILDPSAWVPLGWTDATKSNYIQVPGFDVDGFFRRIARSSHLGLQMFARRDEARQVIIDRQPVSPWFTEYLSQKGGC